MSQAQSFRPLAKRPFALGFNAKGQEQFAAKQEFKDDCDINVIISLVQQGAQIQPSLRTPQFVDCASVPDFATAQNIVVQAANMFAALPSKIRERFANDPARMVSFAADPENLEEAVRLGLVVPPVKEEAKKVDPASPGPTAPPAPTPPAVKEETPKA